MECKFHQHLEECSRVTQLNFEMPQSIGKKDGVMASASSGTLVKAVVRMAYVSSTSLASMQWLPTRHRRQRIYKQM